MRIDFDKNTFVGNAIIWLDRGLNICTGGSFQECLSTRSFIMSETTDLKKWKYVRDAINWAFWEGHCEDSFLWEMKLKQTFITKHKYLIKQDRSYDRYSERADIAG